MTTRDHEVMSLQDMDPELRSGQTWMWVRSRKPYTLVRDLSRFANVWEAIDLEEGRTIRVYDVEIGVYWERLT